VTTATLRALARTATGRSYSLTKWRSLRRMKRGEGTPIVVFSMAKTGSSALFRAVGDAVPNPRFHIHLMAPDTVARSEAHYRNSDSWAHGAHVWQSQYLATRPPTPESPWLVVTAVREPVARSASEFFQSAIRRGRLHDPATTMRLFNNFVTKRGIPHTLRWFDTEFRQGLGVDVYEYPFDPAQGYRVIETPAVRVLLLRQENLDIAARALGEFLGLSRELEIVQENVGSNKEYSGLYASAVRDVRFPKATLDLAYGSRFCEHFYGPDELERFRRSWERSEPSPV
jgi:hypothetical protein